MRGIIPAALTLPARRLARSHSAALKPLRALLARVKGNERVARAATGRYMLYEADDDKKRAALLHAILVRLKSEGRLDPSACLQSSWEQIEADGLKRYASR